MNNWVQNGVYSLCLLINPHTYKMRRMQDSNDASEGSFLDKKHWYMK